MPIIENISFLKVLNKTLRVQSLSHPDISAKEKPTLVFLHEGLGCIELWKGFPELLATATGLNAIVYERQGYGASDPLDLPRPMDYLEREALDYLPELLRQLKIKNPILVGHSDGASIALVYAGRYPVKALISEAAHVFVEEETLKGVVEAKNSPVLPIIKEKLKKYHGDKTNDIFHAWADTWLHPDFRDWNIEAYLGGITCPALIIQGEDDEYATALQVTHILQGMTAVVHKEAFMPSNCAHSPHLQAKEVVLEKMIEFLQEVI
jgi:pimeloyl-ACP methyl ester carboxylesterase